MSKNTISGKVVTVLNERELVINIGYLHEVQEDMKFKVLTEKPTRLVDPDTKEELGVIDREKVRVRASEVFEKFTICKTYREEYDPGGAFAGFSLGNILTRPPSRKVETLRATEEAYPPPLSEEESYVKKGDRVVQILEE